jgi:hypothetical protein
MELDDELEQGQELEQEQATETPHDDSQMTETDLLSAIANSEESLAAKKVAIAKTAADKAAVAADKKAAKEVAKALAKDVAAKNGAEKQPTQKQPPKQRKVPRVGERQSICGLGAGGSTVSQSNLPPNQSNPGFLCVAQAMALLVMKRSPSWGRPSR